MLNTKIPQRLGELSYSIYMIHTPIMLVLITLLSKTTSLTGRVDGAFSLVGPWWLMDAITLAYLCMVVCLSQLTYRLIEVPAREWFNRRSLPASPLLEDIQRGNERAGT